ncbi:MAG TPA: S9 family peptidase [Gemmatimonadaceae bacterium]|nr:S9 family peptidase [Gemmatimonadaceae bacterium]
MLVAGATAGAQQSDPSRVTMDRLFSGDFSPDRTGGLQWLPKSPAYTVFERGTRGGDLVRYDAATGARSVMVSADKLVPSGANQELAVEEYTFSPDEKKLLLFTNSQRVWRQNTRGDYWVYDLTAGTLRKLGGPAKPSTLMFAKFSPDGSRVAYVREHNLYVETVADGNITALTTDGSPTIINGTFDWVYEEELNDRDGFRWSPDGTRIAYWQLDDSGVHDYDLIDDTDSLYSYINPVQYPKAGTPNSAARVGIVDATGGATRWLALPGDPRAFLIARLMWAGTSDAVVVQRMNRVQNENQIILGDARTGALTTVLTERDSAWVDAVDDMRWFEHGQRFLWVSERDGWRRLYVISRDGRTTKAISPANADVATPNSPFGQAYTVGVDSAGGVIYYTASPENATQLYLFRAKLDGTGRAERVTPASEPGVHDYDLSADAKWAIHEWSSFDKPPVVEIVRLADHHVTRTVTDNSRLARTVSALARGPVEFSRLDGQDAWIMKPPAFDSTKKYPVLFFVYGGPAAQTVLDQWGGQQYLWHLMLTQLGYVVASVDNHGTPTPRGRAWRKAIYKHSGPLESQDQAGAAKALVSRGWADATRVGVWGWSNGGTMTLNLLFRSPELYRMGMAVAPVTDSRFYDTIYTERYLGLPDENPEQYKEASPLSYVGGLRGDLLVVHGSGDDNVHFQNSEALINALVAADKQFTMMDYPNRTHCICEGENTSRHLYGLLTRYLQEHLPANATRAE